MENIWIERENIEARTLAFSLAITLARDARDRADRRAALLCLGLPAIRAELSSPPVLADTRIFPKTCPCSTDSQRARRGDVAFATK